MQVPTYKMFLLCSVKDLGVIWNIKLIHLLNHLTCLVLVFSVHFLENGQDDGGSCNYLMIDTCNHQPIYLV